jgi:carbonic anhydrase/acetyltransferase-like protein (isoleucine patch superfamily)
MSSLAHARPSQEIAAVRPRLVSGSLGLVFLASFGTLTSFYLLLAVFPMCAAAAGAGTAGAGLVTGVLLLGTVAAELASAGLMKRYGYPGVSGAPVDALAGRGSYGNALILAVPRDQVATGRLGQAGPSTTGTNQERETVAMNASDATVTELATVQAASMARDNAPGARVRAGPVRIRHLGRAPSVHPDAYVAPTAVISGQVSIGAGSCIMHGAVLAAEGGPVQIGTGCVIMENAVLRGTLRHPLIIGDRVLAGPHAQLTGAGIADEVFIAAGAMVLNGAHLGRAASLAAGAVVHLGAIVAPLARIPIGWVAVGDPARIYPPGQAEPIQAGLAEAGWGFLPFIFGADDAGGRHEQLRAALQRYTAAMARHHRQDQIIPAPDSGR